MVWVPQCGSSDGGSPRLPILRTPPFFWAAAGPVRSQAATSATTTTEPISLRIVRPPAGGLSATFLSGGVRAESSGKLQDGTRHALGLVMVALDAALPYDLAGSVVTSLGA